MKCFAIPFSWLMNGFSYDSKNRFVGWHRTMLHKVKLINSCNKTNEMH